MRPGTPTRVDVGGKKPSKRKRTRYITGDTSRLSRYTCTSVRPRACKGVAKGFVALASQTLFPLFSFLSFFSFLFVAHANSFSLPLSSSVTLTKKKKRSSRTVESRSSQSTVCVTHHLLSHTSTFFPYQFPSFFLSFFLRLLFHGRLFHVLILTTFEQRQQRPAAARRVSSAPGHYHRPAGSVDCHEVDTSASLCQRQQHQRDSGDDDGGSARQHRRCW